jgi:hypothetical protein
MTAFVVALLPETKRIGLGRNAARSRPWAPSYLGAPLVLWRRFVQQMAKTTVDGEDPDDQH